MIEASGVESAAVLPTRASALAGSQEFSFINSTDKRLVVVLEPESSEFWIKRGSAIRVVVRSEKPASALDLEFLPGGLVIYLAKGAHAAIYQDGKLLGEARRARSLTRRLNVIK